MAKEPFKLALVGESRRTVVQLVTFQAEREKVVLLCSPVTLSTGIPSPMWLHDEHMDHAAIIFNDTRTDTAVYFAGTNIGQPCKTL